MLIAMALEGDVEEQDIGRHGCALPLTSEFSIGQMQNQQTSKSLKGAI